MSYIALRLAYSARVYLNNIIGIRHSQLYSRARLLRISKISLGIAY